MNAAQKRAHRRANKLADWLLNQVHSESANGLLHQFWDGPEERMKDLVKMMLLFAYIERRADDACLENARAFVICAKSLAVQYYLHNDEKLKDK